MITPDQIKHAAEQHAEGYRIYGSRMYTRSRNAFISGADWALQQQRWISTKERLPEKKGISTYEHIPCLVKYKGWITILAWNCEENCWDGEDQDDYECDPDGVEYYIPLSALTQPPNDTPCSTT